MDRVEYGRRREAIGRQGVTRRSTLERELGAMRDEDERLAERVEEAASLTGQELFGVSERVASGLLPASLMAKVDAAAAQLRWFQGAAEDEGRSRDIRRREVEDRLQEVIDDCRVRLVRLDDEFARGRREGMW